MKSGLSSSSSWHVQPVAELKAISSAVCINYFGFIFPFNNFYSDFYGGMSYLQDSFLIAFNFLC